ncbi:MAG: 16S rRNA (uracil(1498)-N(3))-methyltransferase [Chitinophagaceae bacterium]|nr:16S rRNA (uracil(1498)-N(3))-methyltransferase [Chitinophagaceae bacterium]
MSQLPFFYEHFDGAGPLTLSDANMHYILNVLRMKEGETICLVNGNGQRAEAILKHVTKRAADLEIAALSTDKQRSPHLHIAIAFTKNAARMEWFLEKAAELGIEQITPLLSHRSERTFFKKERFEKILVAAMLQSQQSILPVLNDPAPINEIVNLPDQQKYIAYCGLEYERQPLNEVLKAARHTLFLIGPEGDFTQDEVHLCLQHQFVPVQLGHNRLRTETAGLYVCTLFNAIQ